MESVVTSPLDPASQKQPGIGADNNANMSISGISNGISNNINISNASASSGAASTSTPAGRLSSLSTATDAVSAEATQGVNPGANVGVNTGVCEPTSGFMPNAFETTISNGLIGCIIGKGGTKINEIRY